MKRLKVKPAEIIELEFEDGKILQMCFNMRALTYLAEEINNKKTGLIGPSFYASLIYAGCRAMAPDFTIEEANAIYVTLEESIPSAINGIFEAYCEAAGIDEEELKKKAIADLLQRPNLS